MGRDHMAMAGFPHAIEHSSSSGTDRRLRREPILLCGRLVHVPLRAFSSRKFRHADLEDGFYSARPGLGTLGGRRLPQRGLGKPDAQGTSAARAEKEVRKERKTQEGTRGQRTVSLSLSAG